MLRYPDASRAGRGTATIDDLSEPGRLERGYRDDECNWIAVDRLPSGSGAHR